MKSDSLKVAVIGGGAAGFFAAINLAESLPGAQVELLEKSLHLLAKVRISGGGRCNVTHSCFEPGELVKFYPRGGRELRGPFRIFQPEDTVQWFENRGVQLKTEGDGRMFPMTNDSGTIVNCLTDSARDAGVSIQTQLALKGVHPENQRFKIEFDSGESRIYDRVILATGSNKKAYGWAQALGHKIVPPVPSLFTFKIKDPRLEGLAGLSSPGVRLRLAGSKVETDGPLLVTHWGLSGPSVLKLSAWAARALYESNYKLELRVNWAPENSQEEVRAIILRKKNNSPKRKAVGEALFAMPKRLWRSLLLDVGVLEEQTWEALSGKVIARLTESLTNSVFQIDGKGEFKEEFVTCGGVSLKDIDFKTMQSRRCPGLYFAGEVIDVDALTGGFNFQNAWTTGYLAAAAIAQELG